MKSKGEAGEHLCTKSPYGYTKDPENKKRWIIDSEAAEVVKRIFALCLDELTPDILNAMVKAVHVHAPDKSKEHREQQIDISYDLVGILPASLLNDPQNGETA